MTPNELRIRCAEIDNFTEVYISEEGVFVGMRNDKPSLVPEYCKSIDAITAAVLRLSEEKRAEWFNALVGIVAYVDHEGENTLFYWEAKLCATASALDRATAFVKIHEPA